MIFFYNIFYEKIFVKNYSEKFIVKNYGVKKLFCIFL